MRRFVCVCAIGFAASAGTAPAAVTTASPAPRAALSDSVCQASPNSAARKVAITAVMRPLVGTMWMAVKFQLEQRSTQGGTYSMVQGQNLGRWLHPSTRNLGQRPGDVWRVDKPVVNLPAPDIYRFRVTFRWTGQSGRVLGRAVRFGPTCYQPR